MCFTYVATDHFLLPVSCLKLLLVSSLKFVACVDTMWGNQLFYFNLKSTVKRILMPIAFLIRLLFEYKHKIAMLMMSRLSSSIIHSQCGLDGVWGILTPINTDLLPSSLSRWLDLEASGLFFTYLIKWESETKMSGNVAGVRSNSAPAAINSHTVLKKLTYPMRCVTVGFESQSNEAG